MISIPFFAVPFTLQNFAVFSTFGILGAKKGSISLLLYLAIGATGLPVFSGFSGGIGVLTGPSGGFLLGFLLAIPIFFIAEALARKRKKAQTLLCSAAMVATLLPIYALGSLWYYAFYANGASYIATLPVTVLPFLIPDAVKIFLAASVSARLRRFAA